MKGANYVMGADSISPVQPYAGPKPLRYGMTGKDTDYFLSFIHAVAPMITYKARHVSPSRSPFLARSAVSCPSRLTDKVYRHFRLHTGVHMP